MKKAGFVLGTLVICVMMVAPMAMAGKPAVKSSDLGTDFVSGPTQGSWSQNFLWGVGYSSGGKIVIWDPPANIWGSMTDPESGRQYISWSTHGETFLMFDKNNNWIKLTRFASGTYNVPGNVIKDLHLLIYMDAWGAAGNILLTVHMDAHMLPAGSTVQVVVSSDHVTVSGESTNFHYDNWHKAIDWANPLYGEADHDFTFTVDK